MCPGVTDLGRQPYGCYFLVKNSWGVSFPGETLKDLAGVADPSLPGYFWVSEQNLANNLLNITQVEIKK